MSDYIPTIVVFLVGFIAGMLFYSLFTTEDHTWHSKAIEHNCAYYHPQTGEFTWGDENVSERI